MFGDIVKVATRTAAVALVIGTIVGVFAAIHLPTPDYSVFSNMIGKGFALMSHWVPGFSGIWQLTTILLSSWLAVKGASFVIYSSSIILKIFQ